MDKHRAVQAILFQVLLKKTSNKNLQNWSKIYILILGPKQQYTKSTEKKVGACVKIQCSEMQHHLTHNSIKLIKHKAVPNMKQSCTVLEICTLKTHKAWCQSCTSF